ncbi:M15 family metallopeptidase [Muricauda oceani]|uniref:D-alanyl-D-alanine dipeptidase n=1 Tax=Flagellimonas oceani TaxID=2698672 RepID=A0A6G7J135_9FLAO|nr:M15 family metallopeptidase [Allomuricauda oceani]MBW8244186.1 M15 family metallopeptidase [Allomuricauda oceani]QII44162.1 M15 family metallopeptidase [Allomuricauda oceani]
MRYSIVFLGFLLIISCRQKENPRQNTTVEAETEVALDAIPTDTTAKVAKPVLKTFDGLADTTFVRLADFSEDFAYDMRYATKNNFLKAKVYDCAECYTRVKTAKALIKANKYFMDKGVKIKFYDCYRPNSVQYKMWEIVPNPQYVANPDKGSIHNRGGAVDITLVDMDGNELDMGTDFDYFGKRAYHDNMDLPQEILDNRKLLKETMEAHGFWSIRTEWWHYNLSSASNDPVANFKWECN